MDRRAGADDGNRSGNRSNNDTRSSNENTLVDRKVIIEANKGMGVGVYDEKSAIKWGFVGAITSKYPPNMFIFEAPLELQQSALIAEFNQYIINVK